MITIEVDERDAGRILAGLKERQKKLQKGVTKFGDDFDPQLGANMVEGLSAYNRLVSYLEKTIGQVDSPRRTGRNS